MNWQNTHSFLYRAWEVWGKSSIGYKREIEGLILKKLDAFIRGFITVNNKEDRDDIYNEICRSLPGSLGSWNPSRGKKFTSWWAWGIKKAITDWSYEKRKESKLFEKDSPAINGKDCAGMRLLGKLSMKQRKAVEMYVLYEYAYRDIGRLLHVSPSRAGRIINESLNKMRKQCKN